MHAMLDTAFDVVPFISLIVRLVTSFCNSRFKVLVVIEIWRMIVVDDTVILPVQVACNMSVSISVCVTIPYVLSPPL